MRRMLSTWSALSVIIAMVMCGCGGGGGDSAPSVDVTGTWKGSCDISGSGVSATLKLTQTGGDVTGTIDGDPIGGVVSGNKLTLTETETDASGVTVLEMSGPVEGDSMTLSGTIEFDGNDGSSANFQISCTFNR